MARDTIGESFRETTPPDLRRARDYTVRFLVSAVVFAIAVGGVVVAVATKPSSADLEKLSERVQGLELELGEVRSELRVLNAAVSVTAGLRELGAKIDQLTREAPQVDAPGRRRRRPAP